MTYKQKNDRILLVVAEYFGLTPKALKMGSRRWPRPQARRIATYFLREAGKSWHQIGMELGFDHSCGIYHHRKIYADPIKYQEDIAGIRKRLEVFGDR